MTFYIISNNTLFDIGLYNNKNSFVSIKIIVLSTIPENKYFTDVISKSQIDILYKHHKLNFSYIVISIAFVK